MNFQPSSCVKHRAAELLDRKAEEAVALKLQTEGFRVLAQRLRTEAGESDFVVADNETLLFVEVKARNSLAESAYAVAPCQQARLLEAASLALALHEDWARPAIRFDVALVCHGTIEQLEDAIRYN